MLTLKDKLVETVLNSAGSKDFQHFYLKKDNRWIDVARDGQVACAIFVSRKLAEFRGLIKNPHATVESTLKDMRASGWYKIDTPQPGAVILWEKKIQTDGQPHHHLGFYIDTDKAISHSDQTRTPIIHSLNFGSNDKDGSARKIETFYWHLHLDESISL